MKVIFSPCLYCKSNQLYDLFMLNDTLNFILKHLDGNLDDYDEAFYNDNQLFMPPIISNISETLQYLAITTSLYKLKLNGEYTTIHKHNNLYLVNNGFNIINYDEFQKIVDYIYELYIEKKWMKFYCLWEKPIQNIKKNMLNLK